MTAICPGGGVSRRKSDSPAQVFATGMAAQAAIEAVFGLASGWSAVAVFVASQVLVLDNFCTTDPPPVPTFDASDLADIMTGFPAMGSPGYVKLVQLCQVALWHVYCECASGTAAAPVAPVYPNGPTVSNPGDGPVPLPTDGNTCGGATWFEGFGFDASGNFSSTTGLSTVLPDGLTAISIEASSGTTAGSPFPVTFSYDWLAADGTTVLATSSWTQATQSTSHHDNTRVFTLPNNVKHARRRAHSDTPTGASIGVDHLFNYFCGSGTAPLAVPCCPPDPNLQALLIQVLNTVTAIYELELGEGGGASSRWVDGVRHASLRASGRLVLQTGAVGVRCEHINIPANIVSHPGNPNFFFNLGFITPIAIDVPLRGQRLVFSPQSFALPAFADGIAWTLESGATMDLVELMPAPP